MELSEILIGYDIREMWLDVSDLWNIKRRNTFLLKRDVPKPISVDTAVWPSVFELDIDAPTAHMAEVPRGKVYKTSAWDAVAKNHKSLITPSRTGYRQTLWNDLILLKQTVSAAWASSWKPTYIIAVTKVVDITSQDDVAEYARHFVRPQELQSSWQHLGYDVADDVLTGFISNAGYPEDESGALQAHWADDFNRWHLFDSLDLATKYVDVAYTRDAMHGPFAAYGIYGIQQIQLGEHPNS